MRKNKREGYTQSYNVQAVVEVGGSQLIVGQRVSTCASDAGQLEPDLHGIPAVLGPPATALADCGFADRAVFARASRASRPGTLRERPSRRRARQAALRLPPTRKDQTPEKDY